MNEKEKSELGYLFKSSDPSLIDERNVAKVLCWKYNICDPTDFKTRNDIIHQLFKEVKGGFYIAAPFNCDYGTNISIGDAFFANYNCVILDGAEVTFGDHVLIGPNCSFNTPNHAIDPGLRQDGYEICKAIHVGNNVWFGSNVCVLQGVTIGDNSIIAAGSVVTKDIPENVIAAGNPCKVLRKITEADKEKYPLYKGE